MNSIKSKCFDLFYNIIIIISYTIIINRYKSHELHTRLLWKTNIELLQKKKV